MHTEEKCGSDRKRKENPNIKINYKRSLQIEQRRSTMFSDVSGQSKSSW
jgi:hypothetical protein